MATPPVGAGDVFLVTCGPGDISTALALIDVAKAAGATILLVTAQPKGRAAAQADLVLHLSAQTIADDQSTECRSLLPMGSLYDGALFVLFEVIVLTLIEQLQISPEAMRSDHTHLE
jgi:6-phospho-3-hexuloisomerase